MKAIEAQIKQACERIAPLWPLQNFVAVNPFLGFTEHSFSDTALYFKQVRNADLTLSQAAYHQAYEAGKIGQEDLQAALNTAPVSLRKAFEDNNTPFVVESLLASQSEDNEAPEDMYRPGAFSAYLDSRMSGHWQHLIREETAKWCAAYFDKGQAQWHFPWKADNFYLAWQSAVVHDRNLTMAGFPGDIKSLGELPSEPRATIELAIREMEVPAEMVEEWLYRICLILPGWAGHARYLDREESLRGRTGYSMESLLAVLLGYELALYRCYKDDEDCLLGWKRLLIEEPVILGQSELPLSLAKRLVWQSAYEKSVEQTLRASIGTPLSATKDRPEIQAAFCIDVRSEPFRRQLEQHCPGLHSMGFAGFFGVPLQHQGSNQTDEQPRCPALLAPFIQSHDAHDKCRHNHSEQQYAAEASKRFRETAASCFSFVETFGLTYGVKLIKDAFGLKATKAAAVDTEPAAHIDSDTRLKLATGIVRGLGLQDRCGQLVLLCGHGSETRNNPYASGLDCGACGGYPGDVNARIACAVLNDPLTRSGLASAGISLPKDSVFIAGMHNTTTDEVTLFETDHVPSSHSGLLEQLKEALKQAASGNALQRATSLGCKSAEEVLQRSRDWSQVRPEWGLAGNSGFIIAPRSWTQSADLHGTAFLHEYDPASDPEGAVLENIIAGPMVVGSWINLQYYGSATDNGHFGSGHKAIHNIVGGVGVALGNESDLRPGLPMQSLHNGHDLVHRPSRLHVCIAADERVIDAILEKHPEVDALIRNRWLHLISLGSDGKQWKRCYSLGNWANKKPARLTA